jgi:hypothetical protein
MVGLLKASPNHLKYNSMIIFESFADYVKVGSNIIKRKSKLFTYEKTNILLSDSGNILIDDDIIYSLFNTDNEVKESSNLTSLNSFYVCDEILTLSYDTANAITKDIKPILEKISEYKHPTFDFEGDFKKAFTILKQNVNRKYLIALNGSHPWYNETYNSINALKELSLYTKISPKDLGYLFDIKYIYLVCMLSKKVYKNELTIKKY